MSSPSDQYPPGVVWGKRLICAATKVIVREIDKSGLWEFLDYSWECNSCNEIHCSSCYYEEVENEDILVYGCGRFLKDVRV